MPELRSAVASLTLMLLLLASSCSRDAGDGPAPAGSPRLRSEACSATGLSADGREQPRLPAAVAATRAKIVKAAIACDFDELERLAAAGSRPFLFTYKNENNRRGPAAYWERLEREATRDADADAPMRILVKLLSLRPAIAELSRRIWPAIAKKERPTEKDWEELSTVFTRDRIDRLRKDYEDHGVRYQDWRVSIMADGEWLAYLPND